LNRLSLSTGVACYEQSTSSSVEGAWAGLMLVAEIGVNKWQEEQFRDTARYSYSTALGRELPTLPRFLGATDGAKRRPLLGMIHARPGRPVGEALHEGFLWSQSPRLLTDGVHGLAL
jgi:hypothetical protein